MRKPRIANRNPVVLEIIKKRYFTYKDLGFYDYPQMRRAAHRAGIDIPRGTPGRKVRIPEEIALIIQQHKV